MKPIDRCIELAGGTQQELADLMGVTQSHVSYWRKNGVSKRWAPVMAKAVGYVVTVHDLRPDIFGPPPDVPESDDPSTDADRAQEAA
jgi:DNA-binding transcriptional regulator YdaS (Cro superfamily)